MIWPGKSSAACKPPPVPELPLRLRPDQLAAHLRKNLAPLYLVFGEETLLAQEAADAIRAAARQRGYTSGNA
jgi:hypothetical protein